MIIDLSYPLRPDMLVWPGGGRPVFEWSARANSEYCNETYLRMPVHTGTHVDAPMHYNIEGDTIDSITLNHFWGKAKMCRLGIIPNGQEITLEMVEETGFELDEVEIFVIQTGIERFSEIRDYNCKFPVPSIELLEWLVKNGMKTYMTDAPSVDKVAECEEGVRHRFMFEHQIPVVENLKNLAKLPHNTDFTISAMPLLLEGREGAPCRAAAMI